MTEKWKVIPEFPDYAVSTHGRVKRVTGSKGDSRSGGFLKPSSWGKRYLNVTLYKNGKQNLMTVHSLVLTVFVSGRPTEKHHCNHINGNKKRQ